MCLSDYLFLSIFYIFQSLNHSTFYMEPLSNSIGNTHPTKETNRDKLQTSLDGKAGRFSLLLQLDLETTTALIASQHLPSLMTVEGKKISRSTIIRRAANLYCKHLQTMVKENKHDAVAREFSVLLGMSRMGRHSTKQAKVH